MGVFGRRDKERAAPPRAVTAAAMPLVGPDVPRVNRARQTETAEGWQRDAWYFYDAVGELRSPLTFLANACSQAVPFAAEVDPDTQLITGATDNPTVQRIAAAVLGGASTRAQLIHTITICWQVPGELFVIIRPRAPKRGVPQPDEWLALSGSKVTVKGGSWQYTDPNTLAQVQLGSKDRLLRVWSPHPEDQARADTAVRPALPILREIEKSSMNIAAKLDSRLASNGILPWPQEADFPLGTNADGSPMNQATSVASFLMEAMTAALSNPGTAGSQAPIVVTMPSDLIDTFSKAHMDLSTTLDSQVVDLRDNALTRLFRTLDMPKDVAEGSQGDANHWGAWQIEEMTYKIFLQPLLQRVGDALTEHWFHPALEAAGVPDVQRYILDWNTTEIIKRPDATEDANWLWDNQLVSNEWRRGVSAVPDDAIPDDDELELRRLETAVRGAPTLAADPQVAQRLFGFEVAPAAAGVSDSQIEGAPELEAAPADDPGSRDLPDTQDDVPAGLVAAAELIVFDALSRAGGRLLTAQHRGRFPDVPKHELHTVIAAADPAPLLRDSFQFSERVADAHGINGVALDAVLVSYTRDLLTGGHAHDRSALTDRLRTVDRRR